jgi:hypothetical protein
MKRKKTIVIFDDKSEPLALSSVRRKPGTVFLIVPSEYLDSTRKCFRLVAEAARQSLEARDFDMDEDKIAEALVPQSLDARTDIA